VCADHGRVAGLAIAFAGEAAERIATQHEQAARELRAKVAAETEHLTIVVAAAQAAGPDASALAQLDALVAETQVRLQKVAGTWAEERILGLLVGYQHAASVVRQAAEGRK
jgi:soluble lytic murein transglycosylase-like protein